MAYKCSHALATSTDGTSIAGFCPRCLITLAIEGDVDERSQFTPGLVLNDRFRINALIGRGGMGEVYRADDLTLGQVVALKFVPSEIDQRGELVGRLRNEVRLGRQVSHPNVCRLYELLEHEGRHFVVMEFIEGEDLGALMRRAGRLPLDTALNLGREICAGLTASHDRGIVHGDLKPSNVMIDGHGRARITDFGLSTFGSEGEGKVVGTLAYMAPEQLQGSVSTASDVYSLGLVLYELFTGQRLHDVQTMQELKSAFGAKRDAPLMKRVPESVRDAVEQCLSEDPAARPQSVRQILAAFPGGDLLDAALAAGETPSPELVAAAEKVHPLSPVSARLTLVATLFCLVLALALRAPAPAPEPVRAVTAYLMLLPALLIAGLLAARRNIRLGRVDARGALRIAAWVFFCRMLAWVFGSDHLSSLVEESRLVSDALGRALFSAAQAWLGYMAVEPYIRRRRPQTIIGWRRLLDGRIADPIVGRDVLIGSAIGVALTLLQDVHYVFPGAPSIPAPIFDSSLARIFYFQTRAIFYSLFALFLLVLLRNLFRPRVIGSVAWVLLAATMFVRSTSMLDAILALSLATVVLFALKRFGLLATAVALFSFLALTFAPLSLHRAFPIALVVSGLATWGFWVNQRDPV